MPNVKFKYLDEACVYPKLVHAVNILCVAKGKDCLCTSGYRSLEKQKIINQQVLANSLGSRQLVNGSVYNTKGQCLAAAYGNSNHCYCIALDITDEWFKKLTNSDLYRYGLYKPMSYEPWHVQLLEHSNITQQQKETIRDSVLSLRKDDGKVTVKEFQTITGLTADGIIGPKTKEKAQEVLQVCQEILGNKFNSAEEVVKATQNSPNYWMDKLKTVKYLDGLIMNIVNKMGGKA